MCNTKKSTGSTERVLANLPDGPVHVLEDPPHVLEDDVFSDSTSSHSSLQDEAVVSSTDDARAAVDVEHVFDHWNKKKFFEKIDSISLDFWAGGRVSLWTSFTFITILSIATRLYYVTEPYKIVWDETHFGKMVSWYINGTYFSDVHPPGGKLMLTLFGWMGGYNGSHPFKNPSDTFEGYQGIIHIRVGCALMGAALAPLAFCSAWTMTRRLPSAFLAAILVVAEIGTLLLSKFILLDSPLFFFMMAAFTALCRFHHATEKYGSFSGRWWTALVMTGVLLGCVVSVKFVGLFMVAVVGLYTIHSLWDLYANTKWTTLAGHLLARVLCLIAIPVAVYVFVFSIHDALLYKSFTIMAAEEAALSPEFQMGLQGNLLHAANYTQEVKFGSVISLRNNRLAGPYLHSHNLTYPSKQVPGDLQQVTGYRAKDYNNLFRVLYPMDDPDAGEFFYSGPPEPVVHGDFVRLFHAVTNASLAVAGHPALVIKKHRLVHADPYTLQKPALTEQNPLLPRQQPEPPRSHIWRVELVGGQHEQPLETFHSRFSLVNVVHGCVLTWSLARHAAKVGDSQEEITCSKNTKTSEAKWRVEFNFPPINDDTATLNTSDLEPLGFWGRFVESHQLQHWTNAHLKPEGNDKHSPYLQRPWMWPICYKSQPWYDVAYRIVLLGNPVVIWLDLLVLVAVACFLGRQAFLRRRMTSLVVRKEEVTLEYWCRWLLIAYLFHYLPFYTMDRILYYHHYFPALQFSSLLTAVYLGHHIQQLSPRNSLLATLGLAAVIMYSFVLFCYVSYGHPTDEGYNPNVSTYRHLRLLDTWFI